MTTAQRVYGPAFGVKDKAALAEAMADWAEMSEAEQSFVNGHLAYLNLQAQAELAGRLGRVEELLDDLVELQEPGDEDTGGQDDAPASPDEALLAELDATTAALEQQAEVELIEDEEAGS